MVLIDLQTLVSVLVVGRILLVLITVVNRSFVSREEVLLKRTRITHGHFAARLKLFRISLLRLLSDHARLEQVCLVNVRHGHPTVFLFVVELLKI